MYTAPGIIEEPSFAQSLRDIARQYPLVEDVKEAIDWWFERDFQPGHAISGLHGYYVAHTRSVIPAPKFVFVYRDVTTNGTRTIYLVDIVALAVDESG